MEKGTVIKSTGSWYQVALTDGEILPCRIIGKFRLNGIVLTNPVAVGDLVKVEKEKDGSSGMIKQILPRRNYVIRQSPRKKHQLHLLASNIDQAVIIVTIVQPKLKQGFIDRFLLMLEPHNIPAVIVFNKMDVYSEEDLMIYELLNHIYDSIGYPTLLVSALEDQGLEALKNILRDKTTLIGGQSGVGKSTLVNSLQPQLKLKTTDISDFSGKGKHTTTFAECFLLILVEI